MKYRGGLWAIIFWIVLGISAQSQQICAPTDLPGTLRNGLVALYPFCGDALDKSGNGLNGVVRNVKFGVDRNGNPNSAGVFRKSDTSRVEVSAHPLLQPGSYTLSAWFKTNIIQTGGLGSEKDQTIAIYSPSNWQKGPSYKLSLDVVSNSQLVSRQWSAQTSWQDVLTTAGYVGAAKWYHATVTFDSTSRQHKLYINGKLYAARSSILRYEGQISFIIGATRENIVGYPSGLFDGSIDDVALWNRALTESEVATLYDPVCRISGFNPLSDSLRVCAETLSLTAGTGYASYRWSDGSSGSSLTVRHPGTYSVRVTDSNGCIGDDTVFVSIANADIQQSDKTLCAIVPMTLSASITPADTNNMRTLPALLLAGNVAWYPLNGSLLDQSGNNYHLSAVSSLSYSTDWMGRASGALNLDRTELRASSNIFRFNYASAYTVSFWLKHEAANEGRLLSTENPEGNFRIASYGNGAYAISFGGGPYLVDTVPAGKWVHIAYVYDNRSVRFYKNGKLNKTFTNTTTEALAYGNPFSVGSKSGASVSYWKGGIGQLGIWQRALSADDVTQLYNRSIEIPASYLWSTGDSTSTIAVTPVQSSLYTLTVTRGLAVCRDSVRVTVATINGFNPLVGNIYSKQDSVKLDAGSGFSHYRWSTGDTMQTLNVQYSGNYRVTVTNTAGCTASDSVFVQFPDTVGLHVSTVNGLCNQQVDVPVRATAFRYLMTMQGSVNWNAADLRFDSISGYGPASMGMNLANFGLSQAGSGRITFSWNDPSGNGLSLADSTTVFTLRFTALGTTVRSVPVTITGTPLSLEFYDAGLVNKTIEQTAGRVNISCEFTISGKVLTPLDQGVRNVTVTLTGGTSPQTARTDSAGNYSFRILPGTYTLTPQKGYEQNKTNGVSTLDIALVQAHILQKLPFNAAYKVIAGDANNFQGVTTADILSLRKLILGTDTTLPDNRLWAFVDGSQTFANPQSPFPISSTKSFTNQSTDVSHTFRAIKIGDVNYDRNPLLDQAPSGDTLRLFGEWIDTEDGYVTLEVKSRAVSGLLGWQSTLRWDAKQLQLQSVNGLISNLGIGERWKDQGYLTLSWNDPRAEGLSFTDGVAWMELKFKKTNALQRTVVFISEEKLGTEAFNKNYQSMGVNMEPIEWKSNTLSGLLRVYPNPAAQFMNVEWKMARAGAATVRLLDAQGRVVHVQRGEYGAGIQRVTIKRSGAWSVAGTWLVQVEVDGVVRNVSVVMGGEEPRP
jgi:hypothetical protein